MAFYVLDTSFFFYYLHIWIFREDQADEYSSLRRELEQTIKNCRVLSFKLKKTERRSEQLEQEKAEHEKKLLEVIFMILKTV